MSSHIFTGFVEDYTTEGFALPYPHTILSSQSWVGCQFLDADFYNYFVNKHSQEPPGFRERNL